jgi:CRP-like cAMP-binding protein
MLLKSEWAERFINTCAKVKSARRRSLAAGESVYLTEPKERCWVVTSGYVRLLDPVADGVQFIGLILGRGGIFGDLPFGTSAFPGFDLSEIQTARSSRRVVKSSNSCHSGRFPTIARISCRTISDCKARRLSACEGALRGDQGSGELCQKMTSLSVTRRPRDGGTAKQG